MQRISALSLLLADELGDYFYVFMFFFRAGLCTRVCVCVLFLCCRATESAEVDLSGISARQHRDAENDVTVAS